MKYLVLAFFLLFTLTKGYSQIKSFDYWGDYAFVNRNIRSNLTPKTISENKIRIIKEKDSLFSRHGSLIYYYHNTKGDWVKTKIKHKDLMDILVSPYYRLRRLLRFKHYGPIITKIDSTENGQIDSIQFDFTTERYVYSQNGNLINIKTDQNIGLKDVRQIKEVKLDYDSANNLIVEKVFWWAGDSIIIHHEYKSNQLIKSMSYTYYLELIQLDKNTYQWRLASKPIIETVNYNYLENGLIKNIYLKNETDNSFKYITYEYEKFK